MNDYLKFAAGVGLYGLWAALVFAGKADASPLVYAIGTGIGAVFGYAGVTKLQAATPSSAPIVWRKQDGSEGTVNFSQKVPTVPLQ